MSNTVIIKGNNQYFSGKLVLTNYGKTRILQRIAQGSSFETFNFTNISLGDKINTMYNSNITVMGNEIATFSLSKEDISISKNTAIIKTKLDLEGEIIMQEIGLFETISNSKKLFAYASGFSMIKSHNVTYDLIIDLSLFLTFENEHYSKYSTSLDETEYALAPKMTSMFNTLTKSQLDLERCVEINTRALGYNKAQAFMLEQKRISNTLRDILLLGRYEKIIKKFGPEKITDCFFYPSEKLPSYVIKNLKDNNENKYEDILKNQYVLEESTNGELFFYDTQKNKYKYAEQNGKEGYYRDNGNFVELTQVPLSQMSVTGDLQICNRDNIDLSTSATIVYTTQLNTLTKENIIIGKINPNNDEYYFDLRVIFDKDRNDYGLQFTIYSYDFLSASKNSFNDERKLVGHYRIKYFPSDREKILISNTETMFTFVYNGSIDNPQIKAYINNEYINDSTNFIIDNFNYMGPCEKFKDTCTLRNYSQTVSTVNNKTPMYYLIPEVDNSSIVIFNTELSKEDIFYLSLISKS